MALQCDTNPKRKFIKTRLNYMKKIGEKIWYSNEDTVNKQIWLLSKKCI